MSRAGEAGHWGRVGREREGLREKGMKGNVLVSLIPRLWGRREVL